MKKIILIISLFSTLMVHATPYVTEKVLQNFHKIFPAAREITWSENNNMFEAYFTMTNMKCHVRYDFEGNVIQIIRYYKGELLPPMILINIAKKYPDQFIAGVTELTEEDDISYDIMLQDDKKWYHIKANSMGNVFLIKKFNK